MMDAKSGKLLSFPNTPGFKDRRHFLRRVSLWMRSNYNVTVNYLTRAETPAHWWPHLEKALTAHAQTLTINERWIFPVYVKTQLVGNLVITEAQHLRPSEREDLQHILECTAIPYLEHIHFAEWLRATEGQLREFKMDKNILLFHQRQSIDDEDPPAPSWDWTQNRVHLGRCPMMIEADSTAATFRAAHQIHERTRRLTFLNYLNIDLAHRLHIDSLREFEDTTLYVEDLMKLSEAEVNTLIHFLRHNPLENPGPSFIFGLQSEPHLFANKYQLDSAQLTLFRRLQINIKELGDHFNSTELFKIFQLSLKVTQ